MHLFKIIKQKNHLLLNFFKKNLFFCGRKYMIIWIHRIYIFSKKFFI